MQNPLRSTTSQPHGLTRRFAVTVGTALVLLTLTGAGSAFAAPPSLIITDGTFRASGFMTEAQIQAYLETQPGPLKSLVTADYDKVITLSTTKNNVNATPDKGEAPKPASRIIYEACQAWNISPMVMLTMLQKEQSLLTRTTLTSTTLARAVGAGCPGSLVYPKTNPVATNRYPGFGNQIWHGARLLDAYGEAGKGSTQPIYYPGIYVWDRYLNPDVKVYTKTLSTYKLYIYNPSIGGNTNFYNIYLSRFGDPARDPISGPPGAVFRFFKKSNGSHFFTNSATEANSVQTRFYKSYKYEGVAYVADPTKNSTPLYRFYNKKTGGHFYTASDAERDRVKSRFALTYRYEGVAYGVSRTGGVGAATVYRFYNKKNGSHFYTASDAERDNVKATLGHILTYEGIAFYVVR